ncbi:MAG: prolipoprotein diacylglyceryl transferase [Sphaerochaetaceae bacterium]|nr:prolipoprotein diacylglyceryl transferase [Sphaerochaetaceae bacterium]
MLYIDFPKWISPLVVPFLTIRWYAVMYLVAFGICYALFRYQCKKGELNSMSEDDSLNLFCYAIGLLIVGARVFSTLFYDGSWYYWTHPWMIFWPFRNGQFVGLPGMSYHGGVVGAIIGGYIFAKKYHYDFFDIADHVIAGIPIGYTFGRLGNFINGELWGRVTTSSIGMVFPDAPRFSTNIPWVQEIAEKIGMSYELGSYINLPRHPSQLYEALFEGIILWLIIWFIIRPISIKNKDKHGPGLITGAYFIGYGLFRFIIEYFREPDSQLGFIIALGKETEPTALFKSALNISMGQILCFMMIVAGTVVIIHALKSKPVVYAKNKKQKRK